MTQVRSAIHVRTGQRATTDAVDDWLRHQAEAAQALGDAYEACVYLLTRYETPPDLAVVGMDLLRNDEVLLLSYIRQTWPRAVIVTYAHAAADHRSDLLPLTTAFHGPERIRELLATTAADIVRNVCEQAAAFEPPVPVPRPATSMPPLGPGPVVPRPSLPPCTAPAPARSGNAPVNRLDLEPQHTPLTAQELSALLDDGVS